MSPLQRAIRVLREEGIRSFLFKLLGELGYRRLYLLERSLAEPIPAPPPLPAGLTLSWLQRSELDEYVALRTTVPAPVVSARFENGDRGLVARRDGRLVGAAWGCVKQPYLQSLGRPVPCGPDDVYTFDTYVIPEARGQSIAPLLSNELARHYQLAGCRRAIRATLPDNKPALRAHAKAGFQPYALIGYVKFGPWRHDFYRPLKP